MDKEKSLKGAIECCLPIDISKEDPYTAVANVIHYKLGIYDSCVAKIWTTNLGASNELLLWDGFGYEWDGDWYEGGDVVLMSFIRICDIPL